MIDGFLVWARQHDLITTRVRKHTKQNCSRQETFGFFQKLLQLYYENMFFLSHLEYGSASDSEDNEEDRVQLVKTKEHLVRSTSFDCRENECVKRFREYDNLLEHVASGKHYLKHEKLTLLDRTRLLHNIETSESIHDLPLSSLPFQFKVVQITTNQP